MMGLAAALEAELINVADLSSLTDAALEAELVELARVREQVQAAYLDRLRIFHQRGIAHEQGLGTRSWAAHHLQVAPRETSRDLALADRMVATPQLGAAVRAGQVRIAHVQVINDAATVLPEDVLADVVESLITAAASNHPGRLRAALRAVAAGLDSPAERRAARRRAHSRWLDVATTIDGAVSIQGVLDAESGATLLAALKPLAKPAGPDDTRAATTRRADALTELARQALDTGNLPTTANERPHVTITVPHDALRPQAPASATPPDTTREDTARARPHPGRPRSWQAAAEASGNGRTGRSEAPDGSRRWRLRPTGTLHNGEPLADHALRRLLCDAAVTRVVLDPPSQPLDVGRTTRLITAAQRRALRIRDNGCRYPGCDRPHAWTDAHHVTHWIDGGATDLRNLISLCRTHHRLLHEGAFSIRAGPGNVFSIDLPGGLSIITTGNATPYDLAHTITTPRTHPG